MYADKIITESANVILTEEFATMPDGVRLYTRYAVPKGVEKCPVVYMRTPYEKTHGGAPHDIEEYKNNTFIKRGYAVLLQHCRGRGDRIASKKAKEQARRNVLAVCRLSVAFHILTPHTL